MRFHSSTQPTVLAQRNKSKNRRPSNLRYGRRNREPKRRFILFCEGENTEPQYFDAFRLICKNALVDVEIVPGVGVPMTIAEKAIERARSEGFGRFRRNKELFEKNDQIWAIFDRDAHPNFNNAVNECEQNDIKVGRSNPCFELWLILHEQDYDAHQGRHQVQKLLGELRPEYNKKGAKAPDFQEMVTRVGEAEGRSKKQLEDREKDGNPYGNPSTTVGLLTRAIREADGLLNT